MNEVMLVDGLGADSLDGVGAQIEVWPDTRTVVIGLSSLSRTYRAMPAIS
jgi:hypothetical protein